MKGVSYEYNSSCTCSRHSDVFPFFCPEAVLKLKVTAHSKPHPCLHCPKICPDGESREVLEQKAGSLFSKAAAIMKTKEKARMKEALDDFGLSLCYEQKLIYLYDLPSDKKNLLFIYKSMADLLTAFFHSRRSRALALFFYENALKIEEELEEVMAEEESLCRKGLLHERMADAGEEALLSQSLLFHRKKAVECFRQYAKRIQEDRQKSEALCHHLEKNLFKEIWLFEEVQEYARAAEALEELYACIKEREKKSRKQGDPSGSSGRNCDLNGFHAGAQWKF